MTQTAAAQSGGRPTTCGATWVAAWHASPSRYTSRLGDGMRMEPDPSDAALPPMSGRTIRTIVRPEANGEAVRVHLTNRYGSRPLRVGTVTVAEQDAGASVIGDTMRDVTFGRRGSVTIRAGGTIISDSIPFTTVAGRALAVTAYIAEADDAVTRHMDTRTTSYVSGAANYAENVLAEPFTEATLSAFYMDGLDVLTPVRMNAVIAVGDSITDGAYTTADSYNRWTDALQRRLNSSEPGRQMVVLNGAISANRLLVDAPFFMGESAISRLRWDIATNAGVTDVILHEGTNDIGIRSARNSRVIIGGLKRFATDAHNLGLRVFVTTIAPAETRTWGDRRANRIRNAVNQWIRNSGAASFDGVFDFAASVANPSNRNKLAPLYDSGDALHVSDLGQARFANAVDVNALSGSPCLAS